MADDISKHLNSSRIQINHVAVVYASANGSPDRFTCHLVNTLEASGCIVEIVDGTKDGAVGGEVNAVIACCSEADKSNVSRLSRWIHFNWNAVVSLPSALLLIKTSSKANEFVSSSDDESLRKFMDQVTWVPDFLVSMIVFSETRLVASLARIFKKPQRSKKDCGAKEDLKSIESKQVNEVFETIDFFTQDFLNLNSKSRFSCTQWGESEFNKNKFKL